MSWGYNGELQGYFKREYKDIIEQHGMLWLPHLPEHEVKAFAQLGRSLIDLSEAGKIRAASACRDYKGRFMGGKRTP